VSRLDEFALLVGRGDDQFDLGRAALLYAGVEYPDLNVDRYMGWLEVRGRELAQRLSPEEPLAEAVRVAAEFMFGELGFRGNAEEYYDPRNSYLNDVIERRLGIPITLSAVLMELGRRAGLQIDGVGLPGHFLVAARREDEMVMLDAFAGGRVVGDEDCIQRLRQIYGPTATLDQAMLATVPKRAMLFRMLNNLKQIYVSGDDRARAVRTIGLMLAVEANSATEYRDRGLLRYQSGDHRAAAADLARYLELSPDSTDQPGIRRIKQTAELLASRLN
jgi:regulator of sirC expression with transglutaminase-like and TPR domain